MDIIVIIVLCIFFVFVSMLLTGLYFCKTNKLSSFPLKLELIMVFLAGLLVGLITSNLYYTQDESVQNEIVCEVQ